MGLFDQTHFFGECKLFPVTAHIDNLIEIDTCGHPIAKPVPSIPSETVRSGGLFGIDQRADQASTNIIDPQYNVPFSRQVVRNCGFRIERIGMVLVQCKGCRQSGRGSFHRSRFVGIGIERRIGGQDLKSQRQSSWQ